MRKIDIHTHILPESWPDLQARFGYGGFVQLDHHCQGAARMMIDGKFFREIEANCWDPDVRMRECTESDVNVQVLSTIPVLFNYWAKPDHTLEICKLLNDHIAGIVHEFPQRFVGLGTLPMQSPDLAIVELERCVRDLGLAGVEIGSHINDWNLDHPFVFPVFEAAQALDAAVFIHPWDMVGKERMPKYWLPWLVGMPAETSLAICSMIFGGVFERLPRLRAAFAHGGGAFPGTIGRVAHGFEVRPDLCAVDNPVNPREYIGRFFVDSLVHDERALQYLVDVMGVEHIALGSDYPFPLGEARPGTLIENAQTLTEQDKEWLLYRSALAWLGMHETALFQ